jgi:hypothetical protein
MMMPMCSRLPPPLLVLMCAVAVLLAACGGSGRGGDAAAEPTGPIVAAVVRSDGVLVPFATFEAGKWAPPHYSSIAGLTAPWFADRLDALGTWTLQTPLALTDLLGQPLTVRVTGDPVQVASHCERVWGLPTDLPGTPTPDHEGHRNVGVAFAGDAAPSVVTQLGPSPGESDKPLRYLGPLFDAAEARAAAERSGRGGYEPRAVGPAVAKTPLAFMRLHRVGRVAGVELYLFEAVRTYAPVPARPYDCDDLTVMTGWLAEGRLGALSLLDSQTQLTDCHRKGSAIVQPMAALELGRHLVVFTIDLHYEDETYSVFQVGPNAVSRALSVSGGGC